MCSAIAIVGSVRYGLTPTLCSSSCATFVAWQPAAAYLEGVHHVGQRNADQAHDARGKP
jgi:hypothetical protein